ncbi:Uu.00g005600.m01.CDS01 [Anthostomella pinea]|uniref:Uu.00g005600.m01.CDS01 n=1 Tax=Anthostomella pinea TaxID=933095 RepID=A0AAI8VLB4_9PEZI|nr:Uu.00g005600.m01.CDS01 [Anthostomella pinea]
MKVLVLGMPRTGTQCVSFPLKAKETGAHNYTQAIADALQLLGIAPVYHMREVGKNNHQDLWVEALDAKFEGKGEPFDRERFDQILGKYEISSPSSFSTFSQSPRAPSYPALADYPAAIFARDLTAAYPEAAIILSTRPEDAWMASMEGTIWHSYTYQKTRPNPNTSLLAPMADRYHRHCWGNDLPTHGRRAFREHDEGVREAAAAAGGEGGGRRRRFLEYDAGSGWGPICEFLGVDVPEMEFPRSDDWVGYKRIVEAERKAEEEA